MSEGHTESAQDIIQADDLVTELLETTEAVFTLRNKTISGPLDLRYHTIHTAVDIQQCYFQGDVDLRWCNFEQAVDFSKYTFHQAFNKVDQTDSQTINCKKDFNCAEAILEGPVSLDRARIEGSATFKKAQFKSSQEAVDFIGFAATMQLNCNEAVFNRPATFNLLECGRGGLFNGATFEGEVDFVSASFDSNLECTGTTFKESANFNLLKSKDDGNFGGTKFEGEVDFSNASFDSGLNCSWHKEHGATAFKGAVSMYALSCGADGNFYLAQFQSPQRSNFAFSKFDGSLIFSDSSFSGPLDLEAVEVSQELDLTAQQFQEVLLFNTTTNGLALAYDVDYDVEGTHYTNHYTFPRTLTSLNPCGFTFKGLLKRLLKWLRVSKEEPLELATSFSVDLRGFTFKKLRGSKEEALQFAKAQKRKVFSLDTYMQLEDHYEKVGMDTVAREVHYEGQCRMRQNTDTSSDIRWTFGRKASDTFLRALTGYGVRTSRVAWAIVIFLVLGTLVFSLGDFTSFDEALAVKTSETSASTGTAQNTAASEPTVVDQISYSVDRFIPLNMGIENGFEPRPLWSEVYALMHGVAGWLLIPLFLASWSGLVRSQR